MSDFAIDPAVVFLNHGSFGACPRPVLAEQARLRERLEADAIDFFLRQLPDLWDAARAKVAAFVGADPQDLVFVTNASQGVSTVLHSLRFEAGDEVLASTHGYNACNNAVKRACERSGATAVFAQVPFPLESPEQVIESVLAGVTPKTKLAVLDHVTSPSGLIFPIERLVKALAERGVPALIDGAHAPGMVPLNLNALGAAYYTGNLHKWVCSPKGAGLLWIRRDLQNGIVPLVTSHGANSPRKDRPRLWLEFDWPGTMDPTPMLCAATAIDFTAAQPGGWDGVRARNRELVLWGRDLLCRTLDVRPPAPDEMIGSLAAVSLPPRPAAGPPRDALTMHPVQQALWEQHRIEVPVFDFPQPGRSVIRIAAQRYNTRAQYELLARVLPALLA
jgi:isopenicillin-N epimerase